MNGFLVRNDIRIEKKATGVFFSSDGTGKSYGPADVMTNQNTITVTGNFNLDSKLVKRNDAITFRKGKHTEQGEVLFAIPVKSKKSEKRNIRRII